MLERSFLHLPGIGPETEERLWSQGLQSWKDLSENLNSLFGSKKALKLAQALEECQRALEEKQFSFFQSRFKGSEMWRLLPSMIRSGHQHEIAHLDIETTGLGFPPQSHSTTIAVLFNNELIVEHEYEKKRKLLTRIEKEARLLVTFNGSSFDLPYLRHEFDLSFSQAHLDLRFWFAKLNYRGGLKAIQKSFQEVPQRTYMDIDGYDAVRLWRMHEHGIPNALETLMTYNAEDTIVLEPLIYCGLNLEARRRPLLNLPTYPLPLGPRITTSVCPNVYKMLRA